MQINPQKHNNVNALLLIKIQFKFNLLLGCQLRLSQEMAIIYKTIKELLVLKMIVVANLGGL